MELNREADAPNHIVGAGDGWIKVGENKHELPLMVTPAELVPLPAGTGEQLDIDSPVLSVAAERKPTILLLGVSGAIEPAKLLGQFNARGIGLEVMDVPAACRTFNILASESRHVIAVLLA